MVCGIPPASVRLYLFGVTPAFERDSSSVSKGWIDLMQPVIKSAKLANVCYDIRGPVLERAKQMEEEGHRIIKLNIGNLGAFGFGNGSRGEGPFEGHRVSFFQSC